MSGTWTSGWVTGDIVTAAEFRKGVGAIADTTLGASTASIDLTGLPTSYAHLMIVVNARSDAVATSVGLNMRLNNDAGASQYVTDTILGQTGPSTTYADQIAATSATVGNITGASANAGLTGSSVLWIPAYGGTTFIKRWLGIESVQWNTTAGTWYAGVAAGFWNSTAAINRITLLPTSGNFIAGTRVSVYAMGA